MVFSDTTTYQGIVQEIDFLCDTTVINFPLVDKARSINRGLDEVTSIIIGFDATYDWDDTNNTTLPIGYTDIVATQRDYSFASEHLFIKQIRIKDAGGNWIVLENTSNNEVIASSTVAGTPTKYSVIGSSYLLSPTPNYSSTGGIEVTFQRKASYFVSTDTTKEPGFAPHLHRYLVYCGMYDWAVKVGHTAKQITASNEKVRYTEMIKSFYSRRGKDVPRKIRVAIQNNR